MTTHLGAIWRSFREIELFEMVSLQFEFITLSKPDKFFASVLGTNQRDHFQSRWFWLIYWLIFWLIFIYSYISWLTYIYIFLYILNYIFLRALVPIPSQLYSEKIDVERYRSDLNLLSNCESLSQGVQGRTKRFSSIFCKRKKNFC